MATLRGVGTMRASCVRRFEAGHTRENARATSAGCAARARPSGASERRRRRARRLSVRATDAGRTRADVVDDRSSTRMRSRAVGADAGAVAEKSNGKVYADARWMSEVRQGGMFGMVLMFAMGFGAQYAPWKPWKTMRGAAAVQTSAVASVEDAQTAATLAAFELGLEIGDRDGKKYSEGVVESDAMSEEALEVENASGREKSGGTLTTAFVGGSVIAAAIFAYYERYAIVASVYKALSMLTEVDPKFVSPFDELKRANLEHDSKTDALSAEWAERLQAEKTKSRASASEFERRIESDRAEFEELERALRELISAKDTEISNLVGQLADLKRAYEEERLVSENASAASKDANEQLARSRQALEEAEENKRELSNEMESIKREIVNARDECASLQSALEASRGEHSDASGVVAELEEKLETALSSEESLKRELTAVSEERDSVRSALEMSKSEHSDASDLVAELNERVAALQIEIDEKVALIEDSKRSYAGELAEAKSKNDELSSELTKVKSQAADAMANFVHLDSVVTDIVSTVNELRRLSHMVTEESPIFEHEFVVQDVPALGDGEFVVIVGSWNSWDAQQGDVMTYDAENDVHKGFVQLQTDVVYEYKYCVCTSDGDVRHERLWQTGANSAFCVASSLMEDHDLVQKATLQSKWQPDPANAPISLYRSNGECLTMGATKLMTDLPTSLIADAIDQLSNIITKTEAVVENKNVGSPR